MIYKLNNVEVVYRLTPGTFYRLVWPDNNVNYIVEYTGYKTIEEDPTILLTITMSNNDSRLNEKRQGIELKWGIGNRYDDGSYLETIEEEKEE